MTNPKPKKPLLGHIFLIVIATLLFMLSFWVFLKHSQDHPQKANKEVLKVDKIALKPYLEYPDKEGNIIREYRFFDNMEPTQKDIHGKAVFFNRIDFKNMTDKYKLHSFPLQWSTGRENLRNYEWDTNDQIKVKNGWESSQANYQFIQTNKPDNTIDSLTKNVKGENGFWNQSNCYLNTISDIDLGQVLNLSQEETNNMPYLPLMTKNLVLEFDWLKLITTRFASSLPHTALAHKHLALATNKAAWAQYHQAEEYKYHTLTQDSALEKMIDTAVKKARIYALDQNISEDQVTDQQLREAATKEAHIQKEQMQQKKGSPSNRKS
ncbi:MAG: hypothetical protein U9532_01350 ['Conium maculatum' witches'-broom phytoplasma]|nr:hypothetical protein ['Conium maculatum' witches'-broom phytoplasma]